MRAAMRWIALTVVVLAACSLVGCGRGTETATAATAAVLTDEATTTQPGAADAAQTEDPDEAASGFDLDLLGHGSLEGRDVVVWFWAGY